ncbi:hypothetical protein B0H65DRAFT_512116 [Neurospora tetraspora]|uniref:Uncharacterized protein n=1 Tax=Neurospora tetraspora TaxID=94610 RepID=A0AAE0J7C9_9PEZI|nr:hypothetical protein B0H65DRAFT_512116 [Neurospora tetraspora]
MDHTNPVYLSHPQSEKDFLAQYYARLSLADTDADKKSPIPTSAPSTITIAIETTGTGAIGLTITIITGIAGISTRTITRPDGTVLVPPPIPAHPSCELSPQMAKAVKDYAIEHCCDYMKAKNLLRDKVLENTQEKLIELLQNELDRMSSEEEDDDLDLDSDMEEGDWALEG